MAFLGALLMTWKRQWRTAGLFWCQGVAIDAIQAGRLMPAAPSWLGDAGALVGLAGVI